MWPLLDVDNHTMISLLVSKRWDPGRRELLSCKPRYEAPPPLSLNSEPELGRTAKGSWAFQLTYKPSDIIYPKLQAVGSWGDHSFAKTVKQVVGIIIIYQFDCFDWGEPFDPVSLCRFILIHIICFEQRMVSPASNCLQIWKYNDTQEKPHVVQLCRQGITYHIIYMATLPIGFYKD